MADTQEKVATDVSVEASNQEEDKIPLEADDSSKPKKGRRSGPKRSSISKIQEEAQGFTKGLPDTEVEGRRMTRSAVRGPPPVTPSPPPKRERKSGASGGGRGGKRARQKKSSKEDDDEDEEEEDGEKKQKTPKKTEENGDDDHGDEEEDNGRSKRVDKEDDIMEVDSKPEASNDDQLDEEKPDVNNSDLEPTASAPESSDKKEDAKPSSSEKPANEELKVNNVSKAGEDTAAGKAATENSVPTEQERGDLDENSATCGDAAAAKVVPQESEPVPVPVSQ